MEIKPTKLARAITTALGCDCREADTGVRGVRQIGTFGEESLPILLAIPGTQTECVDMVRQLIGIFREKFVVLTPSSRCIDGIARSALRNANAAIFALESLLTVADDGSLRSNRPASALFGAFVPRHDPQSETLKPTARIETYVFENVGRTWRVIFDGSPEFHIEDTLGARYLNFLFQHPNEPISAFDLELKITPEKAKVREKNSFQSKLDPEAAKAYLRELNKLRTLRDEAADEQNYGEVDRLDREIEDIELALKKTGDSSDAGERARSNVNKAVAAIRKKLLAGDKDQKAFADHIQRFVSIGYECIYNQPEGRIWT